MEGLQWYVEEWPKEWPQIVARRVDVEVVEEVD